MNIIEKFKLGRKVHIKFPSGKISKELYNVGDAIKLKGENFWRRVNSDGTISKVGDGTNGTVHYNKVAPKVRNEYIILLGRPHGKDGNHWTNTAVNLANMFYNTVPEYLALKLILSRTGADKHINSHIVRNTSGSNTNSLLQLFNIPLLAMHREVYDGRRHNVYYNSKTGKQLNDLYTNFLWNPYRNIVHLYTTGDDTGFKPSQIGVGSYLNTEYSNLPAYEGNFYNIKTLYLPTESKLYLDKHIGVLYRLDLDELILDVLDVEGVDDTLHYGMTVRKENNNYYVDFEDVWNTDRAGLDSRNYPFILNLRLPIVFTNDPEKLLQTPKLTEWFNSPQNWKNAK